MSQKIKVKIKKISNLNVAIPSYQTLGSSGADVCACLESSLKVLPGERCLIPTGFSFEIPLGYEIQVRPRSGLGFKNGVTVINAPGTIDSDYRGELKIILINHGVHEFVINPGDRVAQLVLAPVIQADFEEVDTVSETIRGAGGFGSTGINTETLK